MLRISNRNINPVNIVLLSIILSGLMIFPTYKLLEWYENTEPYKKYGISLIDFSTIIIGTLYLVIAILASILFKKLSQQHANAKELRNFKDFTDIIHRCETEIDVYRKLYDFVKNMHHVNSVTLFYRNERSLNDSSWEKLTNERMPLCLMETRNCPLIKYGKECIVGNISMDLTCAYQLSEYKTGSYICLPITDGNHTLAILQLYSKTKYFFDYATISKIKSYIEVARPIISSKRTLYQLNAKASTDRLTKLYNRSYIDPYLERQIEIADSTNTHLSLIMMDIDHFKKFNDTYGHSAGDAVLVVFAEAIKRCLRIAEDRDQVARYGGEEFIAILPATDAKTALSIAERIRETVAMEPMPRIDDVVIPNINCSLGVSVYPILAQNKSDLLKTADIALYNAKKSGRNCVKLYSDDMEM